LQNLEANREKEKQQKRASREKRRAAKLAPAPELVEVVIVPPPEPKPHGPAAIFSERATPNVRCATSRQMKDKAALRRVVVRAYYTEPDPLKRAVLVAMNKDIPLLFVTV
jgi:hypothetical protein